MKRVAIIGGGIAGLSVAFFLKEGEGEGGPGVILLERQARLGGNIRTEKVDGFVVEAGPDCFLTEKPWAMALCKRLGLEAELLPTNEEMRKTYVLSAGRLHELPEGVILMIPTRMAPLLLSPLISIPGKLRMFLEPFIPKRRAKGDETLGDFVRRRLGREALEKIAEPLVAGVHAGDPDTMSIRSAFPKFVELEEEYGSLILGMVKRMAALKGKTRGAPADASKRVTMFMTLRSGLGRLIEELGRRIDGFKDMEVSTGADVAGISRQGDGYELHIKGRDPVRCDAVIATAPSYAASQLVSGLDPGLADMLLQIPYTSTVTVSVAFRKADIRHPMNGFGFVVPRVEKRGIMASTWTSVKFPYRAPEDAHLIRCFLGGAKNPDVISLTDDEIVLIALKELRAIMGIDARPMFARVYKWPRSMPQYTVGHEERVQGILERLKAHNGLYLTGSAYKGIGISDNIRNAEATAKAVLDFLGQRPR
jgi:oxygen-dependent protoporphyrinogen oxidase